MFKAEDWAVTGSPCLQISYSLVRETMSKLPNITYCVLSQPGPNSVFQIDLTCFQLKFSPTYIWTITASSRAFLSLVSLLRFIIHTGATQCRYNSDPVTCLFKKPSCLGSQQLKAQAEAKWPRLHSWPSFLQAVLGQVTKVLCLRFLHLWHGDDIST